MPPIFLDADGVLADFDKAAMEVHGRTIDWLMAVRPRGLWDLTHPLGVTLDEFWEPIHNAGADFWENIELLPWAGELIKMLQGLDWYVVTAPSTYKEGSPSYHGKIKWLERHFGWRISKCLLTSDKHLLARKGAILIDDRESNINAFTEAGGEGIIFPSLGNCLHSMAADPIPYVRKMLEKKNAI